MLCPFVIYGGFLIFKQNEPPQKLDINSLLFLKFLSHPDSIHLQIFNDQLRHV